MKVLGLCSYPIESAATRYRLAQFVAPLAARGIELDVSPFLDRRRFELLYRGKSLPEKLFSLAAPLFKRLGETLAVGRYDALLVQREAMFFGPAVFEWIYQKLGRLPLILDLDDATYISYVSPTYGRLGSALKFFGKTDRLIERADAVVCGNRFIAEYVEKKGRRAFVVPTVVDTDKFAPLEKNNPVPVVGWIGTHSTYPFLESIFPALERVARKHRFKLRIVGSGRDAVRLDGVEVENLPWRLEREIDDFRSLDVGLYPMELGRQIPDEWIAGKSGFKAIQYMAVGIPYVVSPIGVCAEIGVAGETHFAATDLDEWERHLSVLLNDNTIRQRFGENGRSYALAHYTVDLQTGKLIEALDLAVRSRGAAEKNEKQ
jgi:glycosyltransferase involved in cell wall biosynthesis